MTSEPSPFYNSSLRSDATIVSYLKLVYSVSKESDSLRDVCLLGRTWLRQRNLNSALSNGGFGDFEWTAVVALLLQEDLPRGVTKLSPGFNGFQLFKSTLQFLASRDLVRQPLLYQATDSAITDKNVAPVFFDGPRGLNILYKMSPWSYKALRYEARTSLKMLSDSTFDPFEATFMLRSDTPLLRYDSIAEVSLRNVDQEPNHTLNQTAVVQKLYRILMRGLGDRTSLIDIRNPSQLSEPWPLDNVCVSIPAHISLQIGLIYNQKNVNRLVDHGPSAEEPDTSAKFRQFWGDKAELRRFKDGSIRESLVWSSKHNSISIPEQIIRHVLQRHLPEEITELNLYGSQLGQHISGDDKQSTSLFQPAMDAYEVLQKDIRNLEGFPLEIRQILATDEQLRCSSLDIPIHGSNKQMDNPASVVIQFEASGRWPDDLEAIQRTKIALLLKLSTLLSQSITGLSTRVGLENTSQPLLNTSFLDIIYPTGSTFRLRIHHDREFHLLQSRLSSPSDFLPQSTKDSLATALAHHKRTFLRLPSHTQALQSACTRFPPLSPTIRLLKKWFASHLLSPHFPPPLIELLACIPFLRPWPWDTPGSLSTAFLRTLWFLSRWDWKSEPLILDFNHGNEGAMTREEYQAIATRFDAWRKIDPALNRVVLFVASNVGGDGTEWSEWRPAKVVAGRMTRLARAAVGVLGEGGVGLDVERLFRRSEGEYDFLVRVRRGFTRGRREAERKRVGGFKNLQVQRGVDVEAVGFDPVREFVEELQRVFGDAVVFFWDGYERDLIAGLWSPHTAARRFKVHLAYSTRPIQGQAGEEGEGGEVEINKEGILNEIARLGGDMVEKIEVNKN
ncbi:MAG: hypothetical protein M1820_007650 [Bogoriella megaspora]|nr:MAG: hypothetical protein M1820_007650 [Bogoriella megaspora]